MKVVGIAHKVEKGKPMVELLEAEVLCATGVAGDLSGGPGKRQVTLLSADVWHEVCAELKQEVPWTVRRANILLEGVAFSPSDVGRILAVGDLQLKITKETVPCKLMDKQAPGLRELLGSDWRGGVCCQVIHDGDITCGDTAHWREL